MEVIYLALLAVVSVSLVTFVYLLDRIKRSKNISKELEEELNKRSMV